jgi:hypothetical protein
MEKIEKLKTSPQKAVNLSNECVKYFHYAIIESCAALSLQLRVQ